MIVVISGSTIFLVALVWYLIDACQFIIQWFDSRKGPSDQEMEARFNARQRACKRHELECLRLPKGEHEIILRRIEARYAAK